VFDRLGNDRPIKEIYDKSQRYKKYNDFEHNCSVTDATLHFEGIELPGRPCLHHTASSPE
jgi:hypothetical protein